MSRPRVRIPVPAGWTRKRARASPPPPESGSARRGLGAVVAVVLALALGAGAALAAPEAPPRSPAEIKLTFAPVVREAAPAVVNIYTRKSVAASPFGDVFGDPFFQRFFEGFGALPRARRKMENSLGSGVIVREDGLVVTNAHVVEGADEIMVVLSDRREFLAEVIGADKASDLALLRIRADGAALPTVRMGDSDALEVGDLVLAIGNPFGIGQTVTSGIVSAIARTTPGVGRDLSFIQTDAAINPGNSGGALVGVDGELVGINTAIFSRSGGNIGIGFAIPVNLVKSLIRSVEDGEERLARPWLGASVQPVDGDLARALGLPRPGGVLVNRLHERGPAARAGLQKGDVVLAVGGVEVMDERSLNFRLAIGALGEAAELEVWRDGQTRRIALPLEVPPYEPPPRVTELDGRHPLAGATVANLSPGFNRDLEMDPFKRGVVVLGVDRASPASRLGVRRGDVIARVADETVATVGELEAALERRQARWRLEIDRGEQRLSAVIGR